MTKEGLLLKQIRTACLRNPENFLAGYIVSLIEGTIPYGEWFISKDAEKEGFKTTANTTTPGRVGATTPLDDATSDSKAGDSVPVVDNQHGRIDRLVELRRSKVSSNGRNGGNAKAKPKNTRSKRQST